MGHMYSDMFWNWYKIIDSKIDSFAQLIPKQYQTDHFSLYLVTLLIDTKACMQHIPV